MNEKRILPPPICSPDNQRFWEAARERRLLIKKCQACDRFHFYPRSLCPFCFSDRTEWVESAGRATVYSYTVMRRATPPFIVAFVTLEEGVSMMTNIVDADPDRVRIGQPVRLKWQEAEDGTPVPMFSPL